MMRRTAAGIVVLGLLGAVWRGAGAEERTAVLEPRVAAGAMERLRDAVTWLADPQREGRGPGTAGIDAAAEWVATQYHRPDLNEGMILAFRRPDSPYSSVQASLRGIDPGATYEVSWDSKDKKDKKALPGSKLLRGFEIVLPEKRSSDLIVYRRIGGSSSSDNVPTLKTSEKPEGSTK